MLSFIYIPNLKKDKTMLRLLCLFFALFMTVIYSAPPVLAEDPYYKARMRMVEKDIAGRGVSDERVLAAMRGVKRHLFVPSKSRRASYSDHPLPIGEGQTISQPYIVALMTEKLELKPGLKVLEIGTGSGYQAAILAEMGMEVRSIEIREGLARSAGERLKNLGYEKVPLLKQLKEGGRLIIPLGSTTYYQTLTLARKLKEGMDVEHISGVVFVPMTGKMLEGRK
jgi:protein-L-isoaspartate(D-aspartate) O-methyltransferase